MTKATLHPPLPAAAGKLAISHSATPATLPEAPIRLLLVDDDPLIVHSLSEFLRLEGYLVDSAPNGVQAVQMLAVTRYNLVLTDVNMPRTNGLELLRTLRNNYPNVVVLVITGYGTIENAVEAVKMGSFDYLTKPIIDDEIRVTIQNALKQQTRCSPKTISSSSNWACATAWITSSAMITKCLKYSIWSKRSPIREPPS